MDEIITYLCNYSLDHKVGFQLENRLNPDDVSVSNGLLRLVIINLNWNNPTEIPFQFAHEISHVLNGDTGTNYYSTQYPMIKEEYEANKRAIKILLDYCKLNDIEFNSKIQFLEAFGIPTNLEPLLD
ncbi:ImmA/IrrE family metallo-endopeptidase [Lactiplantibacillus plantarum]|uniref:ImmA/IrrE family metallo-endopeptidase n=1 Tax=Lactiplantibacillus plantarum TaxID=1590 RepID=UPI0023786142|nr:ImmA/IrrE family metallo-endopeptidase [Lactiplantibacillus plantarum]WDQ20899.1 ImmA/IrrE family metallo-endopeptidase [Lactiplantibacillus plantarum]